MRHFVDIKIRGNELIERMYADAMPAPFLSRPHRRLHRATARDYNAGGARYNNTYIQGVGIGSLTDSLAAIRTRRLRGRSVSAWPAWSAALGRGLRRGTSELRQRLRQPDAEVRQRRRLRPTP